MARGSNHYEQALEQHLLTREVPLLPVKEEEVVKARGRRVKNFDYLVYRPGRQHWLLEVKGRSLTRSITPNAWTTAEDISNLWGWRTLFGADFQPVLAFCFDVTGNDRLPVHYTWGGRDYQSWLVSLDAFQRLASERSRRWRTLHLTRRAFLACARPLLEMLDEPLAA